MRREVKEAVMKFDATCTYVLACSLMTQIQCTLLQLCLTMSSGLTQKQFYSKIEKNTVDMTFNRLNVIHMYNFGMGSVNVADQICMQY